MGIEVGSGSQYLTSAQLASEKAQTDSLEEKLKNNTASDKELMDACKSFETYLVEQVMKEMEKSVPRDDEEENPYMDQFGDMLYEEYAKKATDNQSLGIAQTLYEAMKRNTGTDTE